MCLPAMPSNRLFAFFLCRPASKLTYRHRHARETPLVEGVLGTGDKVAQQQARGHGEQHPRGEVPVQPAEGPEHGHVVCRLHSEHMQWSTCILRIPWP